MAWSPPYPITVPAAGGDRDEGQNELLMWTEVRDFMNDASPVITSASASQGAGQISTDANNTLVTGSDAKPYFSTTQLNGNRMMGRFDAAIPANTTGRLLQSATETFGCVVIVNDATDSGFWPEKFTFFYDKNDGSDVSLRVKRTGYFNEYGEIRGIAALRNTVACRIFGMEDHITGGSARSVNAPIFEVADDRGQRARLFAVHGDGQTGQARVVVNAGFPAPASPGAENFQVTGSSRFTGSVTVTGTITASNIGVKVTSGTTAPSSPAVGDVWVDVS